MINSLSSLRVTHLLLLPLLICINFIASGQSSTSFESGPLTYEGNFSSKMVEGINHYFDRKLMQSVKKRSESWEVDFSSRKKYKESIAPNRKRFAEMIGVVEQRADNTDMEYVAATAVSAIIAENEHFTVYTVKWRVFDNVYGEGLLLQPQDSVKARVVAVPDASQTPEMLVGIAPGLPIANQYARHLAENGTQVIIPTIVDRSNTFSGNERMGINTNQPHREWIYRQAYTFGRHIIGYEVQKILAAVDWFVEQDKNSSAKIGVLGWGEGGLLSFYSAAIDPRIDIALVSGYFNKREKLWKEPIYRNVFGLLNEFGDAEIARLIVPRSLIIEYATFPEVEASSSLQQMSARSGASAAPGSISTPKFSEVKEEVERARQLSGQFQSAIKFLHNEGSTKKQFDKNSRHTFWEHLQPSIDDLETANLEPLEVMSNSDFVARQRRQVRELENYTQQLIRVSRNVREDFFWERIKSVTAEAWQKEKESYQKYFWNEIIGRIPPSNISLNPKSRQIYDESTWSGYEVTIDVVPDIFVWGYLLIPKNIKRGEKRPTVVVQHGGSGVLADVLNENHKAYKGLAVKLVKRGFIVFAPHFPWRLGERYRNIQRKANPLGLSLFSVILNQHERILDWLTQQSWVDPKRIGLYGLSWGGKVAMRVPAILDQYSLAICSGDFNEWIWKNATTDWQNSYMFVPEYEMFDFNLGMTFSYGEMAALIAPRAFMVERGHDDGVGIDEWVAYEYAKVNRFYDKMNIPEMTEIEFFNGGHEINAEGTVKFMHRIFDWPLSE